MSPTNSVRPMVKLAPLLSRVTLIALIFVLACVELPAAAPDAAAPGPSVTTSDGAAAAARSSRSAAPALPPRSEASAAWPRGPWRQLVASRFSSGLLASWSGRRLVVGPWHGPQRQLELQRPVQAATFDAADRLHLVSGRQLITVLPDGQRLRRQQQLPGATAQLLASRDALLWVGAVSSLHDAPAARLSRDGANSWRVVPLPPAGNAGYAVALGLEGELQVMSGMELGCGGGGQHRERGELRGAELRLRAAPWPLDAPFDWIVGQDGWAYARLPRCAPLGLCAVGPEGELRRLELRAPPGSLARVRQALSDSERLDQLVAHNGRATVVLLHGAGDDGELLLLHGARLDHLGQAPRNLAAVALDRAGSCWGLLGGELARMQAGHWRPVGR